MASTLPGQPLLWRPKGVSDSIDGTNSFPGAMASLSNLIPSPSTSGQWVPRPASIQATAFAGFTTPAQVEALLVVGNIAYGMIASAAFSGKSEPFAYAILTNTFQTITGELAANLPASTATTGDWTPPTMAVIGSRVMVTHPGFSGTHKVGWLDISGFSDATHTGNTNTSTSITNLSANVITAGWKPGMTITSSAGDIPAGTTIVSIASGGLSLTLSAAATGTNAGVTFTVTGGTATSPQWGSGDTNLTNLLAVPVAVANFNGRAYYAVPGNGMQFSDSGNPTQITASTQALTPNNGIDVSAFGALPISQLTGGALQSLFAFQGDAAIQQITGDSATSNLAMNAVPVGVGTLAPLTVCNTTQGIAFVSPDGLRFITFTGQVTDPVGANGKGVNTAFLNAINPSRMCAAFNQNVLRISVTNGGVTGQPTQEWWLDFSEKVWSGPHTFPASLIQPYQAATGVNTGHGFLLAASGINAKLWTSQVNPSSTSTYTENGTSLAWTYQPVLLPDNQQMDMNAMVQTAIGLVMPSAQSISVSATDQSGAILDQLTIKGSGTTATIWNSFTWGSANWTAAATNFTQQRIPWSKPLIFKQLNLSFTGTSAANSALGNLYMRHERLDYMLPP